MSMIKTDATLSPNALYSLLVYAGRYAWMRQSYALGEMADLVRQYSRYLHEGQLGTLLRDVKEAQEQWQHSANTTPIAQMASDQNTLENLRQYLESEIDDRNRPKLLLRKVDEDGETWYVDPTFKTWIPYIRNRGKNRLCARCAKKTERGVARVDQNWKELEWTCYLCVEYGQDIAPADLMEKSYP